MGSSIVTHGQKAQSMEQLWLVFNQPKYVAGDTAYFRGYEVGNPDGKSVSRVLNLRLINKNGITALRTRAIFENGNCSSQLVLPEELEPGVYTLNVYFERISEVAPTAFESVFIIADEKETLVTYDGVDFFPEGGSMVQNCESRILVATPFSRGVARILNEQDVIQGEVYFDTNGTGSFMFTPKRDHRYRLSFDGNSYNLPNADTSGVVMQIISQKGNLMRIRLQTNELKSAHGSGLLRVEGSEGIMHEMTFGFYSDTTVVITIPESRFREGTALLSAVVDNNTLASRQVVLASVEGAISANLSENHVGTRELLTATLGLEGESADLSVSVLHEDLYQGMNPLPWNLSNPFHELGPLVPKADSILPMNNFLIAKTHSERPKDSTTAPNGWFFFRGYVELDSSRLNLPDSMLITFYFTRNDFTYQFFTEAGGYFDFPLLKPFRDEEVFYLVTRKGRPLENATIRLLDVAPTPVIGMASTKIEKTDTYYKLSEQRKKIEQAFTFYGQGGRVQTKAYEFDEIWKEADRVVELNKFEPFATMEQVLSNIVQSARTTNKEIKGVRVFMKETNTFAQGNPIYFINGRMTEDTELFLNLDPTKISKIGLLRSERNLSQFGQLGKNGALLVKTTEDLPDLYNCTRCLHIIGFSKPIPFAKRTYNEPGGNSRIPDLRMALYWNPSVKIDAQSKTTISFYSSDAVGKFLIIVRGVTDSGKIISKVVPFTVENHKEY